jgi:hypothetical protein
MTCHGLHHPFFAVNVIFIFPFVVTEAGLNGEIFLSENAKLFSPLCLQGLSIEASAFHLASTLSFHLLANLLFFTFFLEQWG